MEYVGVDGCPDGWLAVEYSGETFCSADQYDDIEDLWEDHDNAELILIDVPIGLREKDNTPRPCDAEARDRLGSRRSRSVFPTPVRGVLEEESYEDASQKQEELTDGSLGAQTRGISDKIGEMDEFMRANQSEKEATVRESHPEVCYWALNDGRPTEYSKTGQPVAAFWEWVEILEGTDEKLLGSIREAGKISRAKRRTTTCLMPSFLRSLPVDSLVKSTHFLRIVRPMTAMTRRICLWRWFTQNPIR